MNIELYVGPKLQFQPEKLSSFDNGKWAAERKYDGVWTAFIINGSGLINEIYTRKGTLLVGDVVSGLHLNTDIPNTILIGELEASTQAATKSYYKLGYRRVWVFDAPMVLGEDVRHVPYFKRRDLTELIVEKLNDKHFCHAEQRLDKFTAFYKEIKNDCGEGIVLKKLDSAYESGDTSKWHKIKSIITVDFYVMGIGATPSGLPNLDIGLYIDGKLKRVQSLAVPKGYTAQDLQGRVIECIGDTIMDSGALRHARFNRTRNDKSPDSCVIK